MQTIDIFEWTFSPSDYFETPFEVVRDDYTMTIDNGRVEARIDALVFDADPSIRDLIHRGLIDRFLGAQVVSFRPYELSDPKRTRLQPDGRRDTFIELKGAAAVASVGTFDVLVTRRDGSVATDSKRERVDRKKTLADLVAFHSPSDAALAAMLVSYSTAIQDPQNELVHLYEIRDCLSTRFGGKASAIASLGLHASEWSKLGQLCNDEPLRQGRHRGTAMSVLRDASEAELQEARKIARNMIQLYLSYLERMASARP